jgi:hypothetical protein
MILPKRPIMGKRAFSLLLVASALPEPSSAQIRLGPEFQVNTYTTFVQTEADVAATDKGGFVVVWNSWNQNVIGSDVYAQRYDASGTRLGGEFRVNSYVTSTQYQQAVASDANGNFVVVWSSNHDGSNFGVFGQRFNAAGVPQGQEFQVNVYTTGTQASPAVALDADGNFVVVWRGEGPGDDWGVFGRRYTSSGTSIGSAFRVNSCTTNRQWYPTVASDSAGNVVVAWQSLNQDLSNDGVFAQRYDAAGAPLASEFQVNTTTTFAQYKPDVSSDGAGNFVVVWRGLYSLGGQLNWGISGQRFHPDGTRAGPEFQVNTFTTGDQQWPAVAMGADGNFVVAWMSPVQDGSSYGVFGRHFQDAGTAPGAEFRVNSYTTSVQNYPSLAIHRNGTFLVVWDSFGRDGDSSGVFGQRFAIDLIFRDGFEDVPVW